MAKWLKPVAACILGMGVMAAAVPDAGAAQRRGAPSLSDQIEAATGGIVAVQPLLRETGALSGRKQTQPLTAGSGIVLDAGEGLIVTAGYLVGDAGEVRIVTAGGIARRGEVVARDDVLDLAVVRTLPSGLEDVRFSQGLPRIGDDAVPLGHAYGLGLVATRGMVSAVRGEMASVNPDGAEAGLILLDAEIHNGMGGGPVLNRDGEVIGMAFAQFGATETTPGRFGIVMPARDVLRAAAALIEEGRVVRTWIGATFHGLNRGETADDEAEVLPIVTTVQDNSPAARSGLRPGDVILSVNGQVLSAAALTAQIVTAGVGTNLRLEVARADGSGRTDRITLQTEERPTSM